LIALVASCASSGGGGGKAGEIDTPARFTGFPPQAFAGIVFAEAHYYINHAEIFDADLIEEEKLVPIMLKIGLRGQGQNEARVRISPEDMEFCLYLPDGTPMPAVDYQKVQPDDKKVLERVIQAALKGSLLEPWERAEGGVVYFRLPDGAKYDAKHAQILRRDGDVTRRLDLAKSLCAFKVTIENELVPFHVGIQPDRRVLPKSK
jgi:hypothetical protein